MEIGLIGLGKMGFNMALNMNDKGYTVLLQMLTQTQLKRFLNKVLKAYNQ